MKNHGHYILDVKGRAVPEPDLFKWAEWFEKSENRLVNVTDVGKVRVSTIFLGLDHCFGEGPPILWETIAFGDKMLDPLFRMELRETLDLARCAGNREQAEAMHEQMVRKMTQKLNLIIKETE